MSPLVLTLTLLFVQLGYGAGATTILQVGNSNWNVAGSWDNGEPGAANFADVPGGRRVTVVSSGRQAASLLLGTCSNGVTSGTSRLTVQPSGELTIGGALQLGSKCVSTTTRGDVILNGGVTTVDSVLFGAVASGGGGQITINSGSSFTVTNQIDTSASAAASRLFLNGGTFSVGGAINVAILRVADSASASYTAQFDITAPDMLIAFQQIGTFTVGNSITVTTGTLRIGEESGSVGTMSLLDSATLSATQLRIGAGPGSTGTLNVDASSSITTSGSCYIGYDGGGTLDFRSGSIITTGNFIVARVLSGNNAVVMGTGSSSPTLTCNADLRIGDGGTGEFLLQSGTISSTSVGITIGQTSSGVGNLTIVDGTISALELLVGRAGTGLYLQNGGSVTTTQDFFVSRLASSTGTATVTAGTLNVGRNLIVADAADCSGTLSIQGGSITIASDVRLSDVDTASATLNVEGGTLQVQGDLDYRSGGFEDLVAVSGAGTLQITGNAIMTGTTASSSNFNTLELSGGACTVTVASLIAGPTSRLSFAPDDTTGQCAIVASEVALDGAQLVVQTASKKRALVTSSFTHGDLLILDNIGANPVVGEFAGFGEGDTVVSYDDGTRYLITYVGGDGNDVQLLQDGVPAE